MAEYGSPVAAIAGLLDSYPHVVESAIAQEDIAFGSPVMGYAGADNLCYAPHKDKVTTLLDADLVASNVITTTINGTAIATTYATSHAATMTAHIAAINASTALIALGVSAVAGATNRGIVISGARDADLTVTQAVTLGATQAGATVTYGTNGRFLGVAVFVQTGGRDYGAGTSGWKEYDSVSICTRGRIYVPAESTVSDKEAAYAVISGTGTLGNFSDVSTNNYDVGGYFRSTVSGGLAVLEVNGLK